MSKKALVPIEQRTTDFYGDEIITVVVEKDGDQIVYIPLRPICNFLGLDWSGQRQRINRNLVLNSEKQGVVVTPSPSNEGAGGGPQEMMCLPLDYLNGWLFGINAERVKPEIQEQVVRYQRECYKILSKAFLSPSNSQLEVSQSPLVYIREMSLAIAQLAQEQIELDSRLQQTEIQVSDHADRLDKAANFFKKLDSRVGSLEKKLSPADGQPITMEQASEISQAVKTLAITLGEKSGKNEFQGVYGQLYRTFGITSYKTLPVSKFAEAMKFLNEWYASLNQ